MNESEQREFLDGILNHSKHTVEQDYNVMEIFQEVSKKISSSKNIKGSIFENEDGIEVFDEKGFFNMDLLFEYSKQVGIEPTDLVAYCFDKVQNVGSFSHLGQTFDFSNANNTFNQLKKQFEEYKKSEDINNF